MRNLYRALYLALILGLSSVSAGVETIGDFSVLENWTGLVISNQQTPCGDVAATLTVPGKAGFEYTEPVEYLGWETPTFADMHDEIAVGDWFDYRYIEFQIKQGI